MKIMIIQKKYRFQVSDYTDGITFPTGLRTKQQLSLHFRHLDCIKLNNA